MSRPISEALREEIKRIVPQFVIANDDKYYQIMDKMTDESAAEYINKILDAADNAIESVDYEDSAAGNGAINNALDAINKLRPNK